MTKHNSNYRESRDIFVKVVIDFYELLMPEPDPGIEKPPAGKTGGESIKLVSEQPHTVVHVHQSSFDA